MLIHGDCLDVLPTLPNASVDMVLADLPYAHSKRKCTDNDWDVAVDLTALWAHLLRVSTPTCPYIFTATQPFMNHLINSQPTLFRYDLVWIKGRPSGYGNARKMPLRKHESIAVFYRKLPIYNPMMTTGALVCSYKASNKEGKCYKKGGLKNQMDYNSDGTRFPVSTLNFNSINNRISLHPTQKPTPLMEWLIRTYTNEGDTVLDPTCGSATTAVAAMNTGRKWVCIEKDANYHAVAAKRIANHQIIAPPDVASRRPA